MKTSEFSIGQKVHRYNWPKDTHLTVEWFNDRYVAGTLYNSISGQTHKRSFEIFDEDGFLMFDEPSPTVKVVKRVPKSGETYINGGIVVRAQRDHIGVPQWVLEVQGA